MMQSVVQILTYLLRTLPYASKLYSAHGDISVSFLIQTLPTTSSSQSPPAATIKCFVSHKFNGKKLDRSPGRISLKKKTSDFKKQQLSYKSELFQFINEMQSNGQRFKNEDSANRVRIPVKFITVTSEPPHRPKNRKRTFSKDNGKISRFVMVKVILTVS